MTPTDLFTTHQHLVHVTRKRVYNPPPPRVDPDDLESAGLLGLWKAAQRFDPGQGVKFTSYAVMHIRFAMRELLRQEAWGARYSYATPGAVPDLVSLDVRLADSDERIADLVPDPAPTPEQQMFPPERNIEARRLAARLLWALPKRQRKLVWLAVGQGLGTREIAARIDRGQDTARQSVNRAVEAAKGVAAGW